MAPRFELITGPMFSGKTSRLIEILAEAERSGQVVVATKPQIDDRFGTNVITSHNGRERAGISFVSGKDLVTAADGADLVGLDEGQFLDQDALEAVRTIVELGIPVVATALDLDFRGERFAATDELERFATTSRRLAAICGLCGSPATHTQRFVAGQPAPLEGPVVLIGGSESYEPRCEPCFWRERGPSLLPRDP